MGYFSADFKSHITVLSQATTPRHSSGIMAFHPLRDLTASEIKQAASLVRQLHRGQELVFKAITLAEPQKDLVLQYFKAQENGTALPAIPRIVFAAYYFKGTVCQHSRHEF